MSDEEDKCGTGARLQAEYEITEEELSYAWDLWNPSPCFFLPLLLAQINIPIAVPPTPTIF
jgi:hypothetical protein